jgi:hypothetical protein
MHSCVGAFAIAVHALLFQLARNKARVHTVKHESEKASIYLQPAGAQQSRRIMEASRAGQELESNSAAARSQAASGYQVPGAAANGLPRRRRNRRGRRGLARTQPSGPYSIPPARRGSRGPMRSSPAIRRGRSLVGGNERGHLIFAGIAS